MYEGNLRIGVGKEGKTRQRGKKEKRVLKKRVNNAAFRPERPERSKKGSRFLVIWSNYHSLFFSIRGKLGIQPVNVIWMMSIPSV